MLGTDATIQIGTKTRINPWCVCHKHDVVLTRSPVSGHIRAGELLLIVDVDGDLIVCVRLWDKDDSTQGLSTWRNDRCEDVLLDVDCILDVVHYSRDGNTYTVITPPWLKLA